MENLKLKASQSTPSIEADVENGKMEMRGDSYPENSFEFFAPVVAWIEEFLQGASTPLRLELHLLYLNTSSVKVMMDIFDMLESQHENGREVSVQWFYDPDNSRIAELAEEFKEDCTFSFEVLACSA